MRKEQRILWILGSLCRGSPLSQSEIEKIFPVVTKSSRIREELDCLVRRGTIEKVSCLDTLEQNCYRKTDHGHKLLADLKRVEDGIGIEEYCYAKFEERIDKLEPN